MSEHQYPCIVFKRYCIYYPSNVFAESASRMLTESACGVLTFQHFNVLLLCNRITLFYPKLSIMFFLALKRLKIENWGISPGEYPPVYPSFRTYCAVLHFDQSQASENLMDYQKQKW